MTEQIPKVSNSTLLWFQLLSLLNKSLLAGRLLPITQFSPFFTNSVVTFTLVHCRIKINWLHILSYHLIKEDSEICWWKFDETHHFYIGPLFEPLRKISTVQRYLLKRFDDIILYIFYQSEIYILHMYLHFIKSIRHWCWLWNTYAKNI